MLIGRVYMPLSENHMAVKMKERIVFLSGKNIGAEVLKHLFFNENVVAINTNPSDEDNVYPCGKVF